MGRLSWIIRLGVFIDVELTEEIEEKINKKCNKNFGEIRL